MFPFLLTFLTSIVIGVFTSSCSPQLSNHGFDKEDVFFSQIKVDLSRREDVQTLLGSPTTISHLPLETWYYISNKTSTKAFSRPKAVEQSVTEVTFSPNGVVKTIKITNDQKAREISPVKRETSTVGHNSGVFREIFSNFGRVAPKAPSSQ